MSNEVPKFCQIEVRSRAAGLRRTSFARWERWHTLGLADDERLQRQSWSLRPAHAGSDGRHRARRAPQSTLDAARLHHPDERHVACPNQDVVYGFMDCWRLSRTRSLFRCPTSAGPFLGLSGGRSAHRQLCATGQDVRDATRLLPARWVQAGRRRAPAGITKVFQCKSNTGVLIPRVYQDDSGGRPEGHAGGAGRHLRSFRQ